MRPSYEELVGVIMRAGDVGVDNWLQDEIDELVGRLRDAETKAPPAPKPIGPLLGITGHRGAGKDEVAALLVRLGNYTQVAFADRVKTDLFDLFLGAGEFSALDSFGASGKSFMLESWLRYIEKNKRNTYPVAIGWVGPMLKWYAEWCKDATNDRAYWVKKVDLQHGVVVSDVRFLVEADAIFNAHGGIIKVTRPGCVGDSHVSETEQDHIRYNWLIENDGTLEDLEARVRVLLNDHKYWFTTPNVFEIQQSRIAHGFRPLFKQGELG